MFYPPVRDLNLSACSYQLQYVVLEFYNDSAIIFIVDESVSYFISINGLAIWSVKYQQMVQTVDQCLPNG